MNSERIDPETLAAFLDGTLPARDRERLLQALAKGGTAYEDLIEAQSLRDASQAGIGWAPEEASPQPLGVPMAEPVRVAASGWRRRTTWAVSSFLAAASIVGVVLLQRRDQPSTASPTAGTMALVTAAADGADPATRFGAGWDQTNWSTTRGATDSLDDRVFAFRLGVRFVDLALAVLSTDRERRQTLARTVASMASSVPAGNPVAARVAALAAERGTPPSAELAAVSEDLRALAVQPVWFDAAVWTESARLAARAHQTTFFARDGAPLRELRRIVAQLNAVPTGATVPNELVGLLRGLADRGGDVHAIGSLLDSTVARGGRN